MEKLPVNTDPRVLAGHAGADDAGVYRVSEDSALVVTVDFFAPIVDDPFDFGRVAATNSLSDVYAMGAKPLVALNIAGFPEGTIPEEAYAEILRGGAEVAAAAGVAIVGGHTVNDKEPKYGLAVVGLVDPSALVTNAGARAGDRLVLTKPLGTGVLATALKRERLDEVQTRRLVDVMTLLNRDASDTMLRFEARACTDVTGFGLLGHANNVARESGVTIEIDASSVPLIEGAAQAVRDGHLTGGGANNLAFLRESMRVEAGVDDDMVKLLVDPQTSGGLLVALPEAQADAFVEALRPQHPQAAVIGRCLPRGDVALVVRANS